MRTQIDQSNISFVAGTKQISILNQVSFTVDKIKQIFNSRTQKVIASIYDIKNLSVTNNIIDFSAITDSIVLTSSDVGKLIIDIDFPVEAIEALRRSVVTYSISDCLATSNKFSVSFNGYITADNTHLSSFYKNGVSQVLPFPVVKGDEITFTSTTSGSVSLYCELSDFGFDSAAKLGTRYSKTGKRVCGYLPVLNKFVVSSLETETTLTLATALKEINDKIVAYGSTWMQNYVSGGLVSGGLRTIWSTSTYIVWKGSGGNPSLYRANSDFSNIVSFTLYPLAIVFVNESYVVAIDTGGTVYLKNIATLANVFSVATFSLTSATIESNVIGLVGTNTFRALDLTGATINTVTLTGASFIDKYSGYMYVTGTNAFWKINPATGSVVNTLVINGTGKAISIVGSYAYFATSTGYIYKVDLSTFTISNSVQFAQDSYTTGIIVIGNHIFLSNTGNYLIRVTDFTTRAAYALDFAPSFIEYNPNNYDIYVSNAQAGGVAVIAYQDVIV